MNKIEEMVKTLCPEGVKTYSMEELGMFYGGLTGKTKEDFKDGNAKFISYKNIYANPDLNVDTEETVKISPKEKQNTIQYGDVLFTGSSETPDECGMSSVLTIQTEEKLYLNSFCFGWRLYDRDILLPGFMKHLFRSHILRKKIGNTANGVTRYNVSKKLMGRIQIPLPPLEIQKEIVNVLDSFTSYAAELQAELQARKEQFQYYIDYFFGFNVDGIKSKESDKVKVCSISELGSLERGKRFVRADVRESGQPCIHYGDMYTYYGISASKAKTYLDRNFPKKMRYAENGDVVIVGAGENDWDIGVGMVWEGEEPAAVHDACYTLKHNCNPKYIAYYLRSTGYHLQLKKKVSSGKICSVSADGVGQCLIPVPSLEEQTRIADALDKFNLLTSDLQNGLPAEIAAVQEQYEYYRNKLLTFKTA